MAETKPAKVSVYREQGGDPPGTLVGGFALGVVHHGVDSELAQYLEAKKNFHIVPRNFNPKTDKLPTAAPPASTSSTPPAVTTETKSEQKPEGAPERRG